jgi:hypothetical protein
MVTSTVKGAAGIFGRPPQMEQTHGTGDWTQESSGTTTINRTGILFVAFGML